jgi:protein N-terminal glutamine amidohydrolase
VLHLDPLSLDYQPYYCEENVWRLLAREELDGRRAWAVIVSSQSSHFVVLHQKAGRSWDGLVCWDYHVFAVVDDPDGPRLALDLDSDLPFPCPLARYLDESFPSTLPAPCFRLVDAAWYVGSLASDRSHMRRPDGGYSAPPPSWPAPGGGMANNLLSWTDVTASAPGTVRDLVWMRAFAARK